MHRREGGTTHPELMRRGGDWRDHPAWAELVGRYEPALRRWCRALGLDGAETDEAVQRVWLDLARWLRAGRYDPSRRFRGWLRMLCRSRARDVLRKRGRDRMVSLDELPDWVGDGFDAREAADEEADARSGPPRLLALMDEAQRAVRARVKAEVWQAFWLVEIEGQSPREAAAGLGRTCAATAVAHRRVKEQLHKEGDRLLGMPAVGGRRDEGAGEADPAR